jgi:hypothetical protein
MLLNDLGEQRSRITKFFYCRPGWLKIESSQIKKPGRDSFGLSNIMTSIDLLSFYGKLLTRINTGTFNVVPAFQVGFAYIIFTGDLAQ